jgi:hypothetical protein
MTQPVLVWRPGEPDPPYEAIAYRLRQRWKSSVARPCMAVVATAKLAAQLGTRWRPGLKNRLQATHDIGVSQMWLELHRPHSPNSANSPSAGLAAAWRSEDQLAHTRRGERCPDEFLVDAQEQVVAVLEFGGSYRSDRVRDFHEDCAADFRARTRWPGPAMGLRRSPVSGPSARSRYADSVSSGSTQMSTKASSHPRGPASVTINTNRSGVIRAARL